MFDDAPPSAGEVRALAHQLLSWAEQLAAQPVPQPMTGEERQDYLLALAMVTREGRRMRSEIFPRVPLGNPNWDVLLELFIQEMNGFRTSLDKLALTGDLPAATVYDSVDALDRLGLIERMPDRFDARVFWLSLTVVGRQGMYDLYERTSDILRPTEKWQPARALRAG